MFPTLNGTKPEDITNPDKEKITMENKKWYTNKTQLAFKNKPDSIFLQLFRYTFVGGFAFIIDFTTLFLLTEYLNIQYLISAGISFILGLIINYFLSIKWVFNDRKIENKLLEFLLFAIIGFVGLGLNELFLWLLTDIMFLYYLLSKVITTFFVYFWNFFARKFLLFCKQ